MHTSKLVQILRKQPPKALKKILEFANCPLHNSNSNITALFKYLLKSRTAPSFSHPTKLLKRHVFREIFPGRSYNDHKMRQLLSLSVKMLENFICLNELLDQKLLKDKILIEYYEQNQLKIFFCDQIRHFEDELIKQDLSSLQILSYKYDLNAYKSSHLYTGVSKTQANHFDPLLTNLDAYYYAIKLQYATNIMAQTFVLRKVEPPHFITPLLAELKEAKFLDEPLIKLYYCALNFLMGQNPKENFVEYQENLHNYSQRIPPRLLPELYSYGFNYAILQVLKGKDDYQIILFKLHQDAIQQEALLEDGFIQTALYKNIATNALRLKKYDWLEEFLETYRDHLPPKERADAYRYNMAKLFFEKKEYKKARHISLTVEYANRFYQIDAKRLLCKIDYETNTRSLETILDALYMQMWREKDLTDSTVKSNKNFVSVVRKLISIFNKEDFQKLLVQIEQTEVLAERSWLLEKVKEKLK